MRISAFSIAMLVYTVVGHPTPAQAQVDQQGAADFFKEAQALCERDAPLGRVVLHADGDR